MITRPYAKCIAGFVIQAFVQRDFKMADILFTFACGDALIDQHLCKIRLFAPI